MQSGRRWCACKLSSRECAICAGTAKFRTAAPALAKHPPKAMFPEFGTVSEIHSKVTSHAKHRNGIPRGNFATLTPRKPRPDRPAQEGDHAASARAGTAEAAGGRARATGQAVVAKVCRVGVTRIARRVGEAHSIRRQGPAIAAQPPGTIGQRLRKPCRRQCAVDLQLGARAGHAPRGTTGETRGTARDRQARGGAAPRTISGCNQTGKEARAKIALALQYGGAPARWFRSVSYTHLT